MELKDLLDLHEKLETRINAYWTYWSVAILAMGGWLFTSGKGLSHGEAIALAIGSSSWQISACFGRPPGWSQGCATKSG